MLNEVKRSVGRGDAKPGCVESTCQIHRPSREVGKDSVKEEEEGISAHKYS